MAAIFWDGFEKYSKTFCQLIPNAQGQLYASANCNQRHQGFLQDWYFFSTGNVNGTAGFIKGRSGTGTALAFNQNFELNIINCIRMLPGNYPHIIMGIAVMLGGQVNAGIQFIESNAGSQCSLWFDSSNHIVFSRSGIGGANILYTSTQHLGLYEWHYIEIDLTISTTAGAFTIWLDGVQIKTASTQNTQAQTNAFVNELQLLAGTNNTGQIAFDDMYLFDNTGPTNNAAIGDCVVDTLFPTADSSVTFTQVNHVEGLYAQGANFSNNPGANSLFVVPITPTVSCTLNSISFNVQTTSSVAKFKGVIYADNGLGSGPGTLMSSGTEVIGVLSGANVTLPLVTPQAVTAGTRYWIGYINDTAINMWAHDNNWLLYGQRANNTYTTGAPSTAPAMTTGQNTLAIWANTSSAPTNAAILSQTPPPISQMASLASVQSSVVGAEDLYTMGTVANSGTIAGVKVTAEVQKTASGSRTMDLRIKSNTNSGNTDSAGSSFGQTPGTGPAYIQSIFTTDPDTGLAWTQSGVNNMKVGFKVAS